MADLAALRVKIGRNAQGGAAYPNFNSLNSVINSGMDWSKYVDSEGMGWQYDKKFGHDDDDPSSPRGQQWGLLLIPEAFAIEAATAWPSLCQRLTEAQTQAFFDGNVVHEEDDVIEDNDTLSKLDKRWKLIDRVKGTAQEPADLANMETNLRQRTAAALNPNNQTRGVRTNPRANWTTFKGNKNITFKEPS